MNAIIEGKITTTEDDRLSVAEEFMTILNVISYCKDEIHLRAMIKHQFGFIKPRHFEIGFGGSHMWVHQKLGFKESRVIFVPFGEYHTDGTMPEII